MELTAMRNIGDTMKKKLNTIGVNSAGELAELGSKEAFFRLKAAYPEVCLVHLYTLQGAIEDTDFNKLSQDTKNELYPLDLWKTSVYCVLLKGGDTHGAVHKRALQWQYKCECKNF